MNNEALRIIHETTEDNMDGSPWPPDGYGIWTVVRREPGRTHWRRVALNQTSTAPEKETAHGD